MLGEEELYGGRGEGKSIVDFTLVKIWNDQMAIAIYSKIIRLKNVVIFLAALDINKVPCRNT